MMLVSVMPADAAVRATGPAWRPAVMREVVGVTGMEGSRHCYCSLRRPHHSMTGTGLSLCAPPEPARDAHAIVPDYVNTYYSR